MPTTPASAVRSLISAIGGVASAAGTVARGTAVREELGVLATSIREAVQGQFERAIPRRPAVTARNYGTGVSDQRP